MAVPDYQSLMLPVLMSAADGEVRIGAVVEKLADELNLSEENREVFLFLPGWRQTLFSKTGFIGPRPTCLRLGGLGAWRRSGLRSEIPRLARRATQASNRLPSRL